MGVFIVRCLGGPYIKIGLHTITPERPNVYFRYIKYGFEKLIHPAELSGRLSFEDLELLAWYPTLGIREEKALHRELRKEFRYYGQFYHVDSLDYVIRMIETDYGLTPEMPSVNDLTTALAWRRGS